VRFESISVIFLDATSSDDVLNGLIHNNIIFGAKIHITQIILMGKERQALDCQPGDILEYVNDGKTDATDI